MPNSPPLNVDPDVCGNVVLHADLDSISDQGGSGILLQQNHDSLDVLECLLFESFKPPLPSAQRKPNDR
ncbi:hypothetical protein R3P38DRAFT_3199135 [Favolaschia claudopus]|uniref:Uncharacterized protein n=1 Tax=Favolaschia claudopus TaxID=2862362 RepID=A0AAW0B0U9_9AGAR